MSSTTVLALNANGDGMDRMKVNASNGLIVDGSGATQPVSGTFFQATQPVSLTGSVTVDGSGVTQPVSVAGSVGVTGTFFQATQPISAASALTVDGSAVTQPVSVAGAVGVTGTFFQATQPVSIAGNVNTVGGSLSVANNSLWSGQTIVNLATAVTTGLDISLYRTLVVYGDTDKTSGEILIQISFDNSSWYDLGKNLYPDGTTGNFVAQVETDAKYIRLSRTNTSGSLETISAAIMIKSG